MLYYEPFLETYKAYIDKPTHPPKIENIFHVPTKFLKKIFFLTPPPFMYIGKETHPNKNPTYFLTVGDSPHLTKRRIKKQKKWKKHLKE